MTRAEQKNNTQDRKVTKLEVVDLGETEIGFDSEQPDIQQKRHSVYHYNKSNRPRLRLEINQLRGPITPIIPIQLNRPFSRYGPPNRFTLPVTKHRHHVLHDHIRQPNYINQQQSNRFDDIQMQQQVPSPIRNLDFKIMNPIASQNNEPFNVHTANYLPPQNQKLPAYSSENNFVSQEYSTQGFLDHEQIQDTDLQNQNLIQSQNHQISDAALFLSENAHAIQQLYGAPASNQDFAPGNDHLHDLNNQIQNPNDQFRNFESTSQSPQKFQNSLPSYASGTLNSEETLEQIQSLEKDLLIVQLQQALAQAQTTSSSDAAGRYAQNQVNSDQNQDLLTSIGQQIRLHISTPQTVAFGSENAAFNQSPFLSGTTLNSLEFPFNYDASTTTQTPITTTTTVTGISTAPQPPNNEGTIPVEASLPVPNRPGSPTITSPVGIPIYGGFVPTLITGNNFIPSYSSSIFPSGRVTPVHSIGSLPTQFGIPIPTEPTRKPVSGSIPLTPEDTKPSANHPGISLVPAITPIALPVQPIKPVTQLHPFVTPIRPISTPLQPVLPATPTQLHPVPATPAVTSSVQSTYGLHTPLVNSVFFKPVKAVYPVYYYPNIAYHLQKSALPSYPWNYAPSYSVAKPVQI